MTPSSILTISTAAVIIDAITVASTFTKSDIFYKSETLYEWYEKYRIGAAVLDILILVIGFRIIDYVSEVLRIKKFSINYYVLAVVLQIIHDLLFYGMVLVIANGYNIIDFFKKYAHEDGVLAIVGDSLMVISTGLLYNFLQSRNMTQSTEALVLLTSIYILTYILYLR